jgi:hypothetical protein
VPPRFAFWTILIDDKPTAFRAQHREDLQPTVRQLSRANPNIVMKWFARGRLWDSPEQARWAQTNVPRKRDKRDPKWRPSAGSQEVRTSSPPRSDTERRDRKMDRKVHTRGRPRPSRHARAQKRHG